MAAVAFESKPALDAKDWQLIELLQKDARTGYAELGRHVGLSAPATAERVKRLEDAGVIRGYRADVDPQKLGYAIEAVLDRIVGFHPSISTTTLVVLQTPYANRPLSRAMWLGARAI